MSEFSVDQREAVQRLLDSIRSIGGGRSGIEAQQLIRFVSEQPEIAFPACQALLQIASTHRGYGAVAVALAAAYDSVYDDDTMSVLVQEHFNELGEQMPTLETFGESVPQADRAPLHHPVPEAELSGVDIYSLVRSFSHRHVSAERPPEQLCRMRGRLYLTFPVPISDPRRVWQVPEVRRYVAAIADAMPYFPYYLAPDPELGMFEVYFQSILDPELSPSGAMDLLDERVFGVIGPALLSTMQFAEALGEDAEQVVRELLAVVGEPGADYLVSLLSAARAEAADEEDGDTAIRAAGR